MNPFKYDIEIIAAPSILGLKPSGVELLAERFLACGLAEKAGSKHPVVYVPMLNHLYSSERDPGTLCLNAEPLRDFSLILGNAVVKTLGLNRFALVLGGDCSLLLGIMSGLKSIGNYGLIFLDAHADFYTPETSTTGEVADMDLAIVTGRGPELLTNINNLRPYVKDENVIHIGQRDWEETKRNGSPDIRDTTIQCIDFAAIEKSGVEGVIVEVLHHMDNSAVDGYWIHFDTDVLCDNINPAVDYRLPDGLLMPQVKNLIHRLLLTDKITGMSVTVFNPNLDKTGNIAKMITGNLARAFDLHDR